jgi:hypothetical protein
MGILPKLQSSELYRISVMMNVTEIKTAANSVCITPNVLKRHTAAVDRICNCGSFYSGSPKGKS